MRELNTNEVLEVSGGLPVPVVLVGAVAFRHIVAPAAASFAGGAASGVMTAWLERLSS